MLAYLRGYADHWGLRADLELSTRVTWIEPDDADTWRVTVDRAGRREVRRYGGVVVCNGHHWDRRWPSYPGRFTGELMKGPLDPGSRAFGGDHWAEEFSAIRTAKSPLSSSRRCCHPANEPVRQVPPLCRRDLGE